MLSRERNSVEAREPMHFKASPNRGMQHVDANERVPANAMWPDVCAVNDWFRAARSDGIRALARAAARAPRGFVAQTWRATRDEVRGCGR
jgi:hypothetical protein